MLLIIVGRTLFQVLAAIETPLEALGAYQVIGVALRLRPSSGWCSDRGRRHASGSAGSARSLRWPA